MACSCGGSGDCNSCDGDGKQEHISRTCSLCYGNGNCKFCAGTGKIECTGCKSTTKGKCFSCDGDGECNRCGGDGSDCRLCDGYGNIDCIYCNDGECSICGGDPVCQTCGGDGTICDDCKNECSSCGAKPDQSTGTINPMTGGNNPSTSQQTDANCYTCQGKGLCPYCGGAYHCKNNYCFFGRVDCSSCYGTGDCWSCSGFGYIVGSDKDCPSCSYGACRSCGRSGDKICTTCGGSGVCNYCINGRCPTCGGL